MSKNRRWKIGKSPVATKEVVIEVSAETKSDRVERFLKRFIAVKFVGENKN